MSQPRFDPRTDAVVRHRWLLPGEVLYWIRNSGLVVFEVPGRDSRGRVLKQSGWRTAGRRAMAVADGALSVIDFLGDGAPDTKETPPVRVFGDRVDCRAATFAEPRTSDSTWVLTNRRFALLRVTSADEPPRTDSEVTVGQFGYHPGIKRRLVALDCVAFGDGSGIDFLAR